MSVTIKGVRPPTTIEVEYTGTDEIRSGYPLFYDWDATAGTTDENTVVDRNKVEKSTLANIDRFAGIVADGFRATGPCKVPIVPPDQIVARSIQVWTNQNLAAGDFVGIIPGTYTFGKWTVGPKFLRCMIAVDRSSTAGLTWCVGNLNTATASGVSDNVIEFYDEFTGVTSFSATDDAATYDLIGTSAAGVYSDSLAGGVLVVTSNTTNNAQLSMNGEPWSMAAEKSLFFRARVATDDIGASNDLFVGLSISDASYWSTLPTDYIGFEVVDGALSFVSVKDGATGRVSTSTGVTLVNNTFVDIAFHYDGEGNLRVWVNNTAITLTPGHEIPDDERLTFMADILGNAARSILLDRVEIANTR
jgi:hypothetical protein